MSRIDRRVRRPGAHRPTSHDHYLIAIFQAKGITSPFTDPRLADKLLDFKERLNNLKRAAETMETALQAVVSGRIRFTYRMHNYYIEDAPLNLRLYAPIQTRAYTLTLWGELFFQTGGRAVERRRG